MKDTLAVSQPMIEAENLQLVITTNVGPVLALKDVNRALSAWKAVSAPRPVERTGVPVTGV